MPLQLGSSLASQSQAWEAGRVFEPAFGRLALVCGLVAHAVASLSVRGQRSRRCVRGSSHLLVGLVRSLYDRWRSTDRSHFHSVRSSGFSVAGDGFSDC